MKWQVQRSHRAFSLLETIVGALLFGVITTCGLTVWTMHAQQSEKAQKDILMSALCQMDLESCMAGGYEVVADTPRATVNIASSWTDVTTGLSKPIEPSISLEFERKVTVPEDGLKQIRVTVYYQTKAGEKKVSLETLLYRTN